MKHPQHAQSGAITLLVTISLVLLASLAAFYSTRSVLTDRLASNNQHHATQARLAAEAALAWGRATLAQAYTNHPDSAFFGQAHAQQPCPAGHTGAQWQCSAMAPPAHPAMPGAVLQLLVARDVVASPHVAELFASASLADANSRAQVQASVFVPTVARAPPDASSAALVVNGCAGPAASASVTLCPLSEKGVACNGQAAGAAVHSVWLPDPNGDGVVSSEERRSCLAFLPEHLPGGGALTGPSRALVRDSCTARAWQNVLGDITPAQVKAWSDAQERQGLHAQSQPARNVYWVDSPSTWTQSLGTVDAPVLLVFSASACALRCPHMASGVHIVGTVVLQSQCLDQKVRAWHAGLIEGQLVVESGLPELQGASRIQAHTFARHAYQLEWPAGMDTTRAQRVAGSWREGAP